MRTIIILALTLCGCSSTPPPATLDVYLLCGQSNMAGRGEVSDQATDPRVWSLDASGKWIPARDPLHWDKPQAGVGPGLTFGKETAERTGRSVGLAPCAVGGSPLNRWEKGGDLYAETVSRAKQAEAKGGKLRAILWHHGETDTRDEKDAATYGERLSASLAALRADLGTPSLPIVVGRLGPLPDKYSHRAIVDAALAALPEKLAGVKAVSVDGLTTGPDGIHFDSASSQDLGRRYAAALAELE